MRKIFFVLFVIAIGMTNCSTPNPATTTSTDPSNSNVNRKSPDTSMMSRDTSMKRDSLRLPKQNLEKIGQTTIVFVSVQPVLFILAGMQKRILNEFKSYLLIVLGIFSAGMGIKGYLLSSHFIDGGVTGISMLLNNIFEFPFLQIHLLLLPGY